MASAFGSAGLGAPALSKPPKKQPQQNNPFGGVGSAGAAPLNFNPNKPPGGVGAAGSALLGAAGGGGRGSGPGAAATTTTAPPPAPAPATPPYTPPLDPGDETTIQRAGADYDTAAGGYLKALQDAAIAYGDPSIMQGLGLGTTVSPNSALALAALAHQQQAYAQNNQAEQAGNFFSTVNQKALGDIDSAQQRAQLAGYNAYQKALGDYTTNMQNALTTRDRIIQDARADERTKAIAGLPTSATTGPTPAGGKTGTQANQQTKAQGAANAARGAQKAETQASRKRGKK